MSVGRTILLILTAGAIAVFLRRAVRILRLVNTGGGTYSFDGIGARSWNLLVNGFCQKIVLKKLSGVGHVIIFWGFFFLALDAFEDAISLADGRFSLSSLGSLYPVIVSGQDIFGVLIAAALAVSLLRRIFFRPKRLDGTARQTVDAVTIIFMLEILMLAFYGKAIFRDRPGWTPVTEMLRAGAAAWGLGPGSAGAYYPLFFWLHYCAFLALLVYIPYSKHSHILFALPKLFLKDRNITGSIRKIDFENNTDGRYGVERISDVTKTDLLDLFACTECGRCQEACPAYMAGKPLSPKKVVLNLKNHLLASDLRAGRESQETETLWPDCIDSDALWSCTTCRACETVCPVENTTMSRIINIRQNRVLMHADFPQETQLVLRNMEHQFNPWALPQDQRDKWADGLGVRTLAEDDNVEYLFFVGCAGSYNTRNISVSTALVRILNAAGIRFGILGNEEKCTGDSARRIGNDYLAGEMARANIETFDRYKVRKIITACPHCFHSLKNEYPQYGGRYQVIHHTELIHHLMKAGKLKPAPGGPHDPGTVSYHDACYLGRYNDLWDQPREVLKAFRKDSFVEIKNSRHDGICCGAGGGRMWMEEKHGPGINSMRVRDFIDHGVKYIATACPFCMQMLGDGIKSAGKEDNIAVRDIAEIIAESV